ncbi:MAG: VapD family protein [Bacillota bacterium]|nr:VapD family protein [Bacillota bacterium]
MAGNKKQITFDLNQKALKKNYPTPNTVVNEKYYKKAYADIQRFMRKNGFLHRQYSVYMSKTRMTNVDIILLMQDLNDAMPWFFKCVTEIDATNIGMQHSLLQSIDEIEDDINVEF